MLPACRSVVGQPDVGPKSRKFLRAPKASLRATRLPEAREWSRIGHPGGPRVQDNRLLQSSVSQSSGVLPVNMSDFEDDEMDVDAPAVKDAITFSSTEQSDKGKRSKANLPVEAEDSLPW